MTAAATRGRVEWIACTDCDYPLDPVAAPRHPSHDITDEAWAAIARREQADAARRDARREAMVRREAQVRAQEAAALRSKSRSRSSRGRRSRR